MKGKLINEQKILKFTYAIYNTYGLERDTLLILSLTLWRMMEICPQDNTSPGQWQQ